MFQDTILLLSAWLINLPHNIMSFNKIKWLHRSLFCVNIHWGTSWWRATYRNVLLVFPYGDTRGHSGLSVCWTVPVSTVWRVQPVTYNNRHNTACDRDTKKEREWCEYAAVCLRKKVSEETEIESAAHWHLYRLQWVQSNLQDCRYIRAKNSNKQTSGSREGGKEGAG